MVFVMSIMSAGLSLGPFLSIDFLSISDKGKSGFNANPESDPQPQPKVWHKKTKKTSNPIYFVNIDTFFQKE